MSDWIYWDDNDSFKRVTSLRAYCSSQKCQGNDVVDGGVNGVLKPNVAKTAVDCPDCRSALFWQAYDPDKDYQLHRTYRASRKPK